MSDNRKRINIMSSCDDNLTDYIFVQLRTMAINLRDKEVHYFLFYSDIPEEKLEKLEVYCECLGNIVFHRVLIENIEPYVEFAKNAMGISTKTKRNRWPHEAYFSFGCHRYLPLDVDRILYIDAGDIIFIDGIDEFYFDDFEGKSLIISPRLAKSDWTYITSKDLENDDYFNIIAGGIFNSGSYMINVDMYREDNIPLEEIVEISKIIPKRCGDPGRVFTDEALLSIVFIDKMKYFKYPEIKDSWYQPYNFVLAFYRKDAKGGNQRELWYDPKIIHFMDCGVKPWKLMDVFLKEEMLKFGQKITIDELLKLASTTKQGELKNTKTYEPDKTIIEPEMIPFFEYWFEINNIVQMELEQIFEQSK